MAAVDPVPVFVSTILPVLSLAGVGVLPPADGTLLRTVGMAGDASIPIFLTVLGIQVARTDAGAALRRTAPAVGLKLLVAPLVGLAVAVVVGFERPAVALEFSGERTSIPVEDPAPAGAAGVAPDGGSDVSGPAYVATPSSSRRSGVCPPSPG